jgi:hypothetical protein
LALRGSKRRETGEDRIMRSSVKLYVSPTIRVIKSSVMRLTVHIACVGEMRNAYKILVARPRRRWEDNNRIGLTEIGWEVVNWLYLPQDRDQWSVLVNMITNLRIP